MIALVATSLLAAFILGPYLIYRLLFAFIVPRRAGTLTRSEEILRAVVLSSFANFSAYFFAKHFGPLNCLWSWHQLGIFFSGVYSEHFFESHQAQWFQSLAIVAWVSYALLWRVYVTVAVFTVCVLLLVGYYARIRKWLRFSFFRAGFATLILPRMAYWHMLLSDVLLTKDQQLHLDVLTKMDFLYQGRLKDKMLGPDGALVNVSLSKPRRFDRQAYLAAKDVDSKVKPDKFWKNIPTELFVIMASEIHTLNLRYGTETIAALQKRNRSKQRKNDASAVPADQLRVALTKLAAELERTRDLVPLAQDAPNDKKMLQPKDPIPKD